jgi:signal transduction histidine kinase
MRLRSTRINAMVAVAAVILVAANAAYSVYRDYKSTVAEHLVIAWDLASVVADQAARSVKDTDLALIQISQIVQSGGGLHVFREEEQWKALRRIAERIPGGTGVVLADVSGTVVASSTSQGPVPISVAERDYMAALAGKDGPHVGAAVKSDSNDEVIYTISRRILDQHGNSVGIASAGVSTSHLTGFYDLFGFKKDPGIAVFRDNGDIIARRPNIKDFIGKNIGDRPLFQVHLKQSPEGVFRTRSPMDGVDRINAYRRVDASGLVVLVGLPWETVTAEWRDRTWRTGLIALFSCMTLIVAAGWSNASLRRAVEAERTLAGERLAGQRLRTFMDMATHEFKTPLAVIDSSAQMLQRLVDTEREGVGSRLTLIRSSVRRVIELLDTCLAGARIDADFPVKLMAFSPVVLIQEVVERQRGRGAAIRTVDVSALPTMCIADPELLGIALDVLLDNARRYGPADGPIDVKASQDGLSMTITVADRGPGIPQDEVTRIFEKYYRGSHSKGTPGTGIGLNLVKTIAELHMGTVTYKPRDGGGAMFSLTIPLDLGDYPIPEDPRSRTLISHTTALSR